MRSLISTFLLTCKRCMCKASFWIGFMALPILICLVSTMTSEQITNWKIGLYTEESGLAEQVIRELCQQDSFFDFYECSSLEEMQEDIMGKRAECGFYFQNGFEEGFYSRSMQEQVMIYYAPSTIADKAARENVYAAVLKVANPTLLNHFIQAETGIEPDSALEALYGKYAEHGNLFHFTYEELEGNVEGVEQSGFMLSPERGVFAVYLWAIGLFSVLAIYEDEKNGIYPLLQKGQRIVLKWGTVWIPVLFMSLSGLIGLGLCGKLQAIPRECGYVFLYGIAITLFSLSMQRIWRKPGYFSCFVTLLLTASVVFCPVFLSVGQFFPGLVWVQKLFIPDYYLEIFVQNNKSEMIFGIIGNMILFEITKLGYRE